MSRVIHIKTQKKLNSLLKQKGQLVVILFTSDKCKNCGKVEKLFSDLSRDNGVNKSIFVQVKNNDNNINILKIWNKYIVKMGEFPIIQFFRNEMIIREVCKSQKTGCKDLVERLPKILDLVTSHIKTPKGYYYKVINGKKRRISEEEYDKSLEMYRTN